MTSLSMEEHWAKTGVGDCAALSGLAITVSIPIRDLAV